MPDSEKQQPKSYEMEKLEREANSPFPHLHPGDEHEISQYFPEPQSDDPDDHYFNEVKRRAALQIRSDRRFEADSIRLASGK